MENESSRVLLEIKGMNKVFGPVTALKNVDLTLKEGDVLGLIGENGSGKSTITSIAAGMQKSTSHDVMRYKGKDWAPSSMLDALSGCGEGNGIGMVVQESGTVAGLTVAENIFLGEMEEFTIFHTKKGRGFGPISRTKLYAAAKKALSDIGIDYIDPSAICGRLDFQSRKLIEIAKVMLKDPDIIVIDETSTALAEDGRKILYNLVNKFRGTHKGVIFISHDLDEIMEVCDTLTVLRDGEIIRTFKREEYEPDQIRKAMIGREMKGDYYRSDYGTYNPGKTRVECKKVNIPGVLENINFELHEGEILGIGGLASCGMHEVGKVLFGNLKVKDGKVLLYEEDKVIPIKGETFSVRRKIGYVSKDRDVESLNLNSSIKDNIAIAGMNEYAINNFLVLESREKKYVDRQIEALSVKCSSRNQLVSQLSGGNKQKVVFGKWIGCDSQILILDCPTRGVDIGVKQAMYQLMDNLRKEGKAILLISEELPELLGMSDRLLIMKDGQITKEFMRSESLSDADIIDYMI